MSGQWPPEWDDSDDGHSDAELVAGPDPEGVDVSAVTAFLASVHAAALPAAFEARISAAIAAEAAARVTTGPTPATEAAGPSAPANRGLRRRSGTSGSVVTGPASSRPENRRRRLRMPSMQAASWVVVCCLVLSGFGFLVSRGGSGSSSSEAASAASAPTASSEPAAGSASKGHDTRKGDEPQPEHAYTSLAPADAGLGFLVFSTGTAYDRSTLASQVQGVLAESGVGRAGGAAPTSSSAATVPAEPSASASAASSSIVGGYTPSATLSACVTEVTGGVRTTLVDEATYDGKPAYIIAVSGQAWVVGLGCTAADPDVIAQVPLKG